MVTQSCSTAIGLIFFKSLVKTILKRLNILSVYWYVFKLRTSNDRFVNNLKILLAVNNVSTFLHHCLEIWNGNLSRNRSRIIGTMKYLYSIFKLRLILTPQRSRFSNNKPIQKLESSLSHLTSWKCHNGQYPNCGRDRLFVHFSNRHWNNSSHWDKTRPSHDEGDN